MNEFDFIRDMLAPLAGEGAFELRDDAAVLRPGREGLVVTADMLVEGRHFRADCPPDTIAKKALRANLSDLAAKGARPVSYLLSIAWPEVRDQAWRAGFVAGLKEDQVRYDLALLGGDTTMTDGPMAVSITAFGAPGPRGMVRRAGAHAGEAVYLTGAVGAAGLGLRVLEGEAMPAGVETQKLIEAYRTPSPAVWFGPVVGEHAGASIDVSDGVLADAAHIAEASGVMLEIDLDRLPLAPATRAWMEAQPDRAAALAALAASGDDYQILMTASPDEEAVLTTAAREARTKLTRVGRVLSGEGLRVLAAGEEIRPKRLGFTHF